MAASFDYDAYGQLIEQTGSEDSRYLYTGQQFDDSTGLYSLHARHYDPALGRFLSRDSYAYNYQNPIEVNRYGYGRNNPMLYSDPSGNESAIGYILKNTFIGGVTGAFSGGIGAYATAWMYIFLIRLSNYVGNGECKDSEYGDFSRVEDQNAYIDRAITEGAKWGGIFGAAIGGGISVASYVPYVAAGAKTATGAGLLMYAGIALTAGATAYGNKDISQEGNFWQRMCMALSRITGIVVGTAAGFAIERGLQNALDNFQNSGSSGQGTRGQGDDSLNGTGSQGDDTINGTGNQGDDSLNGTGSQGDDTTGGTGSQGDDTTSGAGSQGDDTTDGTNNQGDDAIDDTIPNPCNMMNSFSAHTLVATVNGAVAINKLELGDEVLAWNEVTGELGYYPITATISHVDMLLVDVTIDGEVIETTPEHPFYVEGKGWVAAAALTIDDLVMGADGTWASVDWIAFRAGPEPMYNLTIAGAHTFFVGNGRWLVHNDPGVQDLVNDIEAKYPGTVLRVNEIIRNPETSIIITDIDIETANYLIEVKENNMSGWNVQAERLKNNPIVNPEGKK